MSTISDEFKRVYRDYSSEGVASSGLYEPPKADIRGLGVMIDTALSSIANGAAIGSAIGYETRAGLFGDLAHEAGVLGFVWGDGTDSYNGIYQKAGASGAGSWTITQIGLPATFVTDLAAVAADAAAAVATSAESAAAVRSNLNQTQTIGRAVTPVTGSAAALGTYVFAAPVGLDGTIVSMRVHGRGSGTIKIRRFSKSGDNFTRVGTDTNAAIVSGVNNIDLSKTVQAGEYLGFYVPANLLDYVSATGDSGGYYFTSSDSTAFTDVDISPAVQLQIGFDITNPYVTVPRLQGIEEDIEAQAAESALARNGLSDIASPVFKAVEGVVATTIFSPTVFGGWAGVSKLAGLKPGEAVQRLSFDRVIASSGATKINLKVYSREDGTSETSAPPAGCTLLFDQDYPLASLGLTAGASTGVTVDFDFPIPFVKQAGSHLAWRWEARDGSDARIASTMGYASGTGATQSQRGWVYSVVGSGSYTAIGASFRVAVRAARLGYSAPDILATAPTGLSVAGTTVTVNGAIWRNGQNFPLLSDVAISLAGPGKERIDLIVADRSTLAVSAVAGTERNTDLDALEWQATIPANAMLLGRAAVTSAAITVAATGAFRGLVRTGGEGEVAWLIERNRRILRAMLGKVRRAAAVKLGGYGDSITALQSGSPAYSANGTVRDRGLTYLAAYPSDTRATLQTYDFGDGAGAVHTKLGWNWTIKAALDEMAGAAVVTYNNYGIASTTSANSEPVAGRGNGLLPGRIAVPLADALDAVVIAFGMNERGQSTTYANIVNMIGQFRAVGTACIVMGVPRPNGAESVTDWRYTNDALEAAAIDAGAAYVSTVSIADDRSLGGMGLPADVLCSTNIGAGNNHPGIYELNRYGRLAVEQLGLA